MRHEARIGQQPRAAGGIGSWEGRQRGVDVRLAAAASYAATASS
jgi:hypothetical protein